MNNVFADFKEKIWSFYKNNKRLLAWRDIDDPYFIVVSEVMLQQTQVSRVISKYQEFIQIFCNFNELAHADTNVLLRVWSGLGYNKRALYLRSMAKIIVENYDGIVPNNIIELQKLPGIGHATASSICAFAFNYPSVFIETNIRSVYLYEFFNNCYDISDKEIMLLVEQTIDYENPRDWYYALMDYGVYLKKNYKNPNRKSSHYIKQSQFSGSDRQIRGAIIKIVSHIFDKKILHDKLFEMLPFSCDRERFDKILNNLSHDNFFQSDCQYVWLLN